MKTYRSGFIFLTAIVALVLAGCGGSSNGSDKSSAFGDCSVHGEKGSISIDPVKTGVLTVATTLPSAGWWKGTSPNTISGGYEYCLAANLAHRAGLDKVKVKNVSFDALVAGQGKEFDIALAQISITPERSKVVDFSEPYFDSDIGVLAAADGGISENNISSKELGVEVGTTSVAFIKKNIKPKTKPRVFNETEAMITAVLSGQTDAALQDTAIMLGFADKSGGALKVVGQYKSGESYGAVYPKGSPNEDALDDAIQAMDKDGTLDKLSKAWLGEELGGDPNDVPVWAAP